MVDFTSSEAIASVRRSVRNIELVDVKPGYLKLLIKASLDKIPVAAPMMMMEYILKNMTASIYVCLKKVLVVHSLPPSPSRFSVKLDQFGIFRILAYEIASYKSRFATFFYHR